MSWVSDEALARLRGPVELPELVAGRYRVLREVGRGGMGTVLLAEDLDLERRVALKIERVPSGPGGAAGHGDPGATGERLRREALVLARLEHPGIVPVHDAGLLPDGRAFAVTKFVDGERLDHHVRPGMSLQERLGILLRLCDTVAFAHARGTLHRDLKPANVMVGPFGEVLVLDWGVAKALGAEGGGAGTPERTAAPEPGRADGTREGTVVGTPGWMAPEQERGEVAAVDERADVYGLGALLWFLLTGAAPGPPSARAAARLPRDVPRPLRAIALRALAPEREARYASAADLARDVRRFLAQEPVDAWPEGPWRRAARLLAKHRTLVALLAAYLLVRAALILWQIARGAGADAG